MKTKLLSLLKKYNREAKVTGGAIAIVLLAMAGLAGYEIVKKNEAKAESIKYTGLLSNLTNRNISAIKEIKDTHNWSEGYEIFTEMVKANAFAISGEYDKAIELLEQAEKSAKDDLVKEMIIINLANATLANAKTAEEVEIAKEKALVILSESKESPVALEIRGDILVSKNKYTEGVDMYNRAFSLLNKVQANTTSINAKINYYSQYL